MERKALIGWQEVKQWAADGVGYVEVLLPNGQIVYATGVKDGKLVVHTEDKCDFSTEDE